MPRYLDHGMTRAVFPKTLDGVGKMAAKKSTCGIKRSFDRSRRRRQDVIATVTWRQQLQRMMPLRRIARSRPASFYNLSCKSIVDGAHEILGIQWDLRHIVQLLLGTSLYLVPTYIQTTLRSLLDPTLENAPRRAGLFLLCASQLERSEPSRFRFPFCHRYVSHTCSRATLVQGSDRCAGMLDGMRTCVRLASRTRFVPTGLHQRASLRWKSVAGLEIARPLFPAPRRR